MPRSLIEKHAFIVDYIRRNFDVSRHRIAEEFGMNATTVGNIIDRLISEKVIIETEDRINRRSGAGRPAVKLRVNPDAYRFIGINFHDRKVSGVVIDFSGKVLESVIREFSTPASTRSILRELGEIVKELYEKWNSIEIKAIGIGAPGVVDTSEGRCISYERIKDWNNVNLRDVIGTLSGLPVFVEHNANCFALGEAWKGDARKYENVVSVVVRTGVAMGSVKNLEIVKYSSVSCGELGHTVININGPKCWCGNRGCLETYTGGGVLASKIRGVLRKHPDWEAGRNIIESHSGPEGLCKLALEGDKYALRILTSMFEALGIALKNISALLAPGMIVINGSFNSAEEIIAPILKESLEPLEKLSLKKPELKISRFGEVSGAAGAALMALTRTVNPIWSLEEIVKTKEKKYVDI